MPGVIIRGELQAIRIGRYCVIGEGTVIRPAYRQGLRCLGLRQQRGDNLRSKNVLVPTGYHKLRSHLHASLDDQAPKPSQRGIFTTHTHTHTHAPAVTVVVEPLMVSIEEKN